MNKQKLNAEELFSKSLVAGTAGVLALLHLFVPGFRVDNDDDFRRWMYVLLDGGLIEPQAKGGWLKFDATLDSRNVVELVKPTPAGEFLISLRGSPVKGG